MKKEGAVSKNKRLIDSGILFQMHENNCIAIEHCEKGDSMSKPKPVALQLYSVREMLDQDFEGTVRRVAEIGYIGVEAYGGMPGGLKNSADMFAELELEVCSSHVAFPDDANKDCMLAVAEAYGVSRVAVAYLPPDNFETIDSIKGICERLNRAGEFADSNNLSLGYHNHWWEYKLLEGQATLDLMLNDLDSSVFLEIDTYWVQVGGMDAVDVVERAGARAPLIHLKDGSLNKDDAMTAVGAGKMQVPEIVAATAESADWHIVELDRCDGDMMQAVQDSYSYLTTEGLVRGKI